MVNGKLNSEMRWRGGPRRRIECMCGQVGGNRGIKADYCVWVKVAPITKGTESSVPVVSD